MGSGRDAGILVLDAEGRQIQSLGKTYAPHEGLPALIERARDEGHAVHSDLHRGEDGAYHLDWAVPISVTEEGTRRTEDLTRSARLRVETERRLRGALAEGQLLAHYQPQVEIATGRIVGVEALVRRRDSERGLIPPGEFIPLAEETGLIGALGEWVLHEACRQGVRWMQAGIHPLVVAVNLSAHPLRQGDIAESVARVLRQTGFPAERLELELTERALMEREDNTVGVLDRLREQGIRMAVDDFGTGYSSFAYLRRFHLDVLKIDKRFIDEIDQQPDARTIVDAITALLHTDGGRSMVLRVATEDLRVR